MGVQCLERDAVPVLTISGEIIHRYTTGYLCLAVDLVSL